MAGETILIVDADQDIDQRITSALEADGYLVFPASSSSVNQELAGKLKPSLIYFKPLAPSAAGFEPCKAIRSLPALKNVPIVLLASLGGKLDSRFTTHYGIVDYLKLTFSDEEVAEKTRSLIGPAAGPETAFHADILMTQEPEPPKAMPEPSLPEPEDELPIKIAPSEKKAAPRKPVPASPGTAVPEKKPQVTKALPPPRPSAPQRQKPARKSSSLLPLLIVLMVIALLAGGGFLAYQYVPQVRSMIQGLTGYAPQPKQAVSRPAPAPPAPTAAVQPPAAPPEQPPVTPAAPPAMPTAPVPTVAISKPFFSVQVGAFKTEEIAANLVKELQGKGYEAFAQKGVTKDNSPIIRVLVGKYENRQQALKSSRELQAKEKIKTTIYSSN